jgi:hypothetical protein
VRNDALVANITRGRDVYVHAADAGVARVLSTSVSIITIPFACKAAGGGVARVNDALVGSETLGRSVYELTSVDGVAAVACASVIIIAGNRVVTAALDWIAGISGTHAVVVA